ncbi:MAG: MATE family efflux transporter [Sphaerochaetaceae bacterium]|nr:MATE family efflux transporter [Sphaerochaetaceae bacterium]
MNTVAVKKEYSIDMTEGPFFKKMLSFALPFMATGFLQVVYHAADVVVVGQFAGNNSLAAVTSTSALFNLIVNLFVGMATGAGILSAIMIGARNEEGLDKTIHTSAALGVIVGILIGAFGYIFSPTFLRWMDSPEEVIGKATIYIRTCFLGVPGSLTFNFLAAIVRSDGDTKHPLKILSFTGILNVVLNLILVIVFKLDVVGVAVATITSQYVSALLIIKRMISSKGNCRLVLKKIRIWKEQAIRIFQIGIPAGIQSAMFNVANVVVQSSVNSFGALVMAGFGTGESIISMCYTCGNAISQTAMNFCGQNLGANNPKNIKKCYYIGIAIVLIVSGFLNTFCFIAAPLLVSFFAKDPDTIALGVGRVRFIMIIYITCNIQDLSGACLRGLGKSFRAMVIAIICTCGVRLAWVYLVFPHFGTLFWLYGAWPASWVVSLIVSHLFMVHEYRKLIKADSSLSPVLV